MVPFSKYALMTGTVATAFGIGFFMQMSPTAQVRYGAASGVQVATLATALPSGALPDEALVPEVVAAVDPVAVPDAVDNPETATDCAPDMIALAQPAAMVRLSLTSCQAQVRVTLHHNGMMVQAMTDADGALDITLPALANPALYIAEFPDREGAVADVAVPSLADYDRIVLQWRGDAGFLLGAQEFGADFGSTGHRHRDNPGTLAATLAQESGLWTDHGDPTALRAEAYTFPRAARREDAVRFSIEAQVTTANCGREIAAQSLQVMGGAGLEVRELTLAMPDCSAVGDYILLKNMAEDLKIAAN